MWQTNGKYIPMTDLLSWPNAQILLGPPGTWNLQKLHLLLKYLGRNVADAKLDCLFNFESSTPNTWIVPWSDDTHKRDESWLKLMLKNTKKN
mgnify:CR=1 FL=1